ncbi:hypothetical protein Tco_1375463 [Tanacetum coccineum]
MNVYKGRMPTKIELTLEQSQQGVSNDVLVSIEGVEELKRNVWIKGVKKEALHTTYIGINTYSCQITGCSADIEVASWTHCYQESFALSLVILKYIQDILLSIHNDEWNPASSQHHTSLAPPSPNYVPGPEEPEQAPPSPVYVPYVPELAYPEFMPPEDEVLPVEEQSLSASLLPIADSPGYVPESDPEKDPEEDDDGDLKEDPADYPADGGDDGDDKDESSDDDKDDDVDIEEEEEEEEHLAPANSTDVALPAVDHAPSAEETEPFETDEFAATPPPHPAYQVTARISIRDEPPTPFWSDNVIPSPPLPPILSPLPVSSPPPTSPTYLLGYRAAMIRLRAEAPSTSHSPPPHIILSHTKADTPPLRTPPLLPIPLPTSSPSLLLPSANHGAYMPEVCLPPRKRLCFAFGLRYEVRESSFAIAARPTGGFRVDYGFVATMDKEIRHDLERDVSYGITETWDEMLVDMPGAPATDDTELGRRMTEFATRVRQDTDEIYVRLDDEQTERQLMAGRLNMLYRDRRAHARTTLLMEREARMSACSDYRVAGSRPQETGSNYRVTGSGPQETGIVH